MSATIEQHPFGVTQDGHPVEVYDLTNRRGAKVSILSYGGIISKLEVPDRSRKLGNVVLGFDDLKSFEETSPYFGALIGRVGNRIAGGKFELDGQEYTLAVNNGPNALHGGLKGYDKRIWHVEQIFNIEGPTLKFSLVDEDGTEGYPGTVNVDVIYTWTDANTLRIDYTATTTAPTPLNLTNHAYFNLKDGGASDVLGHTLHLEADQYTPVDATLIPTGEIASVEGTPMDFRSAKPIGQDIEAMGGYDHNVVLRSTGGELAKAGEVVEPETGRKLEVWTTEPGMQFYSGNFLDGSIEGRDGAKYGKYHAFCLETQHFPDSIHHPNFPNTVLKPGETYRSTTEYRFGIVPAP